MTAADDLTEAALDAVEAARGVLDVDTDGIPESQWRVLVDAVLAVPAIAAALEAKRTLAKVQKVVDEPIYQAEVKADLLVRYHRIAEMVGGWS